MKFEIIEQTRAAAKLSIDMTARTKESIPPWRQRRDAREPALWSIHLVQKGGGGKGWDLVVFLDRGTWLEIHHGLIKSNGKITMVKTTTPKINNKKKLNVYTLHINIQPI